MQVKYLAFAASLTLLGLLGPGTQAQTTYHVAADTSSLSGQSGFLDFQFAKGNAFDSLDALATLTNVVTGGTLDTTSTLSGDASGILPSPASVANTGSFNDLFQGLTFGSVVSFDVTFTGAALDPILPSSYGSTFAFSLFATDATTPLLTTDPNGTALDISLDPGAKFTAANFPSAPGAGPAVLATAVAVPEVSSAASLAALLMLGGILGVATRRKKTCHG